MALLGDFIFVSGIVLTLLILWILIRSKRKQLSKYILIVFFSFLLLVALNSYSILHDIRWLYLSTTLFDDIVIVLVGPVLYLYIKSLFLDEKSLLKKNAIHFVPVVLYFLFITFPLYLNDILGRQLFSYANSITDHLPVVIILCDSYLILYLVLSLRLFYRYRNAMKVSFASLSEKDFGWVRSMLIGSLLVISFDLATLLFEIYTNWFTWNFKVDLTVIAMVIFIGYLGYYGVNQSKVLLPDFLIKEELLTIDLAKKNDYLSHLTELEIKQFKEKLETVIHEEKPYLDEDITLNKLALLIPTSDKKLSTLLNQHMNTTFYDLINKYRVEAVKEKLNSDEFEKYTLLGVAFESGFKSKTSFNRIFKKETGLSPSEYKKNYS